MKKLVLIATAIMMTAIAFAQDPGIYAKQGDNLIPLEEPKVSAGSVGVGVGGFGTHNEKYNLKGTASTVKLSKKDKIVVVFAAKDQKTKKKAFRNGKDMNNLVLGKLIVEKNKRIYDGGRAFSVGGFNVARVGDEVNTIDITIKQIDENTFEITFPKDIESGEYAFIATEMILTTKSLMGVFAFAIE